MPLAMIYDGLEPWKIVAALPRCLRPLNLVQGAAIDVLWQTPMQLPPG